MEKQNELEQKFRAALDHLIQELNGIRTGRATPALVENVNVSCYQSVLPLKAVASITVPDPRTLAVEVWDVTIAPDVERALNQADIGVAPRRDSNRIVLAIPPLTAERRTELQRAVGKRGEQAKISIRTIREDAMKTIQKKKEEENLSETLVEQEEKEIQKMVDVYNTHVVEAVQKKEHELSSV